MTLEFQNSVSPLSSMYETNTTHIQRRPRPKKYQLSKTDRVEKNEIN